MKILPFGIFKVSSREILLLSVTLGTWFLRVSDRGIWEAFKKTVSKRDVDSHVGQKISHFQSFGMKVFIITAEAVKTKELRKRSRPFAVVGIGRGIKKVAMGVSRFVEHRSDKSIALIETRISKNDTLVSLIFHVNWRAGWKLLTWVINCASLPREHDAAPQQLSMYLPK